MNWNLPTGNAYPLYQDLLSQIHFMIGGLHETGKSTILDGVIYTALLQSPDDVKFIFIDPGYVAFMRYENLPHTVAVGHSHSDIIAALRTAVNTIELRYKKMRAAEVREWKFDGELYVVIDKLDEIMCSIRKDADPLISKISSWGRAAHVHLFATTVSADAKTIPSMVQCNVPGIATKCLDAIHSRQVIGERGGELLPQYGKCLYRTSNGKMTVCDVNKVPDDELDERVRFWTDQAPRNGKIIKLFKKGFN